MHKEVNVIISQLQEMVLFTEWEEVKIAILQLDNEE